MRDTHTAFAVYRNRADNCSGPVWQGRFFSSVLDDAHLWSAIKYVETQPAPCQISGISNDYLWSSAAAHSGLRTDTFLSALPAESELIANWAAWLSEDDPILRQRTNSCRPMGSPEFLIILESTPERTVTPGKRGRKAKRKIDG